MASETVFRKVALDRLSSPDQLDRLITLTSPIGWLAASAVAALLAAIIGWSILGSVPTRVPGSGIFVTRGGQVFDAMASAPGTLTKVAQIGAVVKQGEVVATLDGTQAAQDLEHAGTVLREQETQLAQLVARFEQETSARRAVATQQKDNLQKIIVSAEQRRDFYENLLKGEQTAADQGFLTRRFMQDTRQQMESAEQEGRRARNDLLRIDADELDQKGRQDQEIWHQQEAVNNARRTLDELRIRTSRATEIVSPVAGRVIEIKSGVGTVVASGRSILSIETAGEGLEVILYVPPDQGKKIAPGMEVRLEPANVKKEEYGTLLGRVIDISEFPVSKEGMMAVLQNSQLVTRFSAQGAPYAARVRLIVDANTPSGYAWSAGSGPPVQVSSGTTATAEITVHRQAPISLVLPLLRQTTSLGE